MISSLRLVSECGDTSHVAPVGTNTQAWTLVAPPHWHRKRLGMLCKLNPPKRRFQGIDDNAQASFLPMELAKANNPSFETRIVRMTDVANGFTPFQDGDLLIAKITPCFENGKGGIARGLVSGIGFGSTEFHVLRPRSEIDVRFLYYATICRPFREIGAAMMKGSAGQKRVPAGFLSNFVMPFPNIEGQRLIVRFLDYSVRLINHLTRAKRQQIKLLNEQKQVIINQAVTKGLDPNVRMKPSGVEWIGDVPEHWEVRPLKRWVTINRETLSGKEDPDYEFRYIDIGSVGEGSLTGSPRHMRFANAPSRARRVVRAGDTLISTVRPYLKAVCHIESDEDDLVASTGFAVLTPPPTLDGRYLFYSVLSESFIRLATMHSIGASYPAVEPSRLGCLPVALPPTLDEQLRISAYLDSKLKPTQNMIRAERRQIEFLHEYRTRLIADVVTGKLDVRDVELPDIDVSEGLDEWDEEEEIGQEEIIEPEEMDVDEDN